MLNTKSAIKSFLMRNVKTKRLAKREVNLRPYGTINAGEEKLEKISDTGRVAKCIFFIFTEQNLQTKKHIRDIFNQNVTPRNIPLTFCNQIAPQEIYL